MTTLVWSEQVFPVAVLMWAAENNGHDWPIVPKVQYHFGSHNLSVVFTINYHDLKTWSAWMINNSRVHVFT